MLRVNVGMSRKVSKDYNSTGFTVNIEGEVCVGLDDPEAVVEKIKEFYDLAEESLAQQMDRYQGDSAIAGRDTKPQTAGRNGNPASGSSGPPQSGINAQTNHQNGNGQDGNGQHNGNGQTANGNAATNKQVQFLLNLGKRNGLSAQQLESRIEELLGRKVGVYQLTKQEAGQVIDVLNQNGTATANGNGSSRVRR